MGDRIKLYGFNNLTKSLSFNIYDVCYAKTLREQKDYLAYIDEQYNSDRLTAILCHLTEILGANILNISKQDFDPEGASVNILIADEAMTPDRVDPSCNMGKPYLTELQLTKCEENMPLPKAEPKNGGKAGAEDDDQHGTGQRGVYAHLDKSHVTVHTFPEAHPSRAISTFRVDIDVATCGRISPLTALDYLISSFDSDIITVDYRVRGFTRDENGRKYFRDMQVRSIQDYIAPEILSQYDATDINVYQANLFHSRFMRKEIELQNYLFNRDVYEIRPQERLRILDDIQREMIEIYSGENIYDA
jgi:S-adenosylmethionine decarboxylase